MHRDDIDPGLPIKLYPVSNGEFIPPPSTPVERETERRARDEASRIADRIGMDRRKFLLSSMATALTLTTLSACSDEKAKSDTPGTKPGGRYTTPPEATTEPDAAIEALGGKEFVFDVQTHFLDDASNPPNLGVLFPQNNCGEADPHKCFTVDKYLDLIFNKSDTDVIVISALPFAGSPLNPDVMKKTIELADRLCGERRTLMQGEAHPTNGSIDTALDNMAQLQRDLPIGAWKVYTHAGGPGWFLDDSEESAPQVGQRFIDQARKLGPPIIAVHKGFSGIGGTAEYSDPVDVGPAAAKNPDVSFVVYHSGYDTKASRFGTTEGPYRESQDLGVNRLITSVHKAGIKPGGNVYAELGSTWRAVMTDPTQAAHVIGKLLVAFGEDNVVWGTDSIWYGSPQDQIQAFRAFEISSEFQERYGYPELTAALKAKIFGLNSARVYKIDPITNACRIPREQIEQARLASFDTNATFGPRNTRELLSFARAELAQFASFARSVH
jgi:hypothetical protein